MTDTYLTGGELTALTMVYWTTDPFQFGQPEYLDQAIDGLLAREMIYQAVGPLEDAMWYLTPKGKCLMDAINSIPEPVNQWVIP